MSNERRLFINIIVQKVFIEVNQRGTKATAATFVDYVPMSGIWNQEIPLQFICNKPFLFLIRDSLSGLILIAGRVQNPSAN
jgi:serpin B